MRDYYQETIDALAEKAAQFTQTAVAQEIGIGQARLSKLLSGKQFPGSHKLLREMMRVAQAKVKK